MMQAPDAKLACRKGRAADSSALMGPPLLDDDASTFINRAA